MSGTGAIVQWHPTDTFAATREVVVYVDPTQKRTAFCSICHTFEDEHRSAMAYENACRHCGEMKGHHLANEYVCPDEDTCGFKFGQYFRPMPRLRAHQVERLADAMKDTWRDVSPIPGIYRTEALRCVEATVHELCHAVVFEIEGNAEGIRNKLADHIAKRFDLLRDYESDRSEIATLAVEPMVMSLLGIAMTAAQESRLITFARKNFREQWWSTETVRKCTSFLARRNNVYGQALTVRKWIRQALIDYDAHPPVQDEEEVDAGDVPVPAGGTGF